MGGPLPPRGVTNIVVVPDRLFRDIVLFCLSLSPPLTAGKMEVELFVTIGIMFDGRPLFPVFGLSTITVLGGGTAEVLGARVT